MEESAVDTAATPNESKPMEGEQVSVAGKQEGGVEPELVAPSFTEHSEFEEGDGKIDGKDIGEEIEPLVEGNAEDADDELDLSPEALEAREREKKKKKREAKRLAREKMERHYKLPEPEPEPKAEPEPEPEQEPQKRLSGEEGAEEDQLEKQTKDETENESSNMNLQSEDNLTQLKSSLALSESEDIRTAVSSSEDESHYTRGPMGVSFKADFLEYFQLPSLSDLTTESSDEQLASLRATIEQSEHTEEFDKGKFVNPLTGETESSSSHVSEEIVKEEEVEEEESSSSTTSEFEWPFGDDEDLPVIPLIVETADLAMEMFMDINQSTTHVREESTTAMELERATREVRQIAFNFLSKIIDDAVDTAEYVDPVKELRGKLDKQKLMAQLQKLYGQYLAAKFFNIDVNNKMYDYYRRVGQLRCFDILPPKVELIEYHRYMDAMHLLDHLKKKAEETKKTNSALLASVKLDLDFVHNMALVSVQALETCIRETILRKDVEFLPRIVENELRRMQTMRNEVSDSRLWLVTRQHTLGSLVERKRNFNQISDDLTMDQFLVAQREVTALGTKVEERNHDLNRMRERCTKHMHQLAFIREKTSMNSATLCNKRIELDEKIQKQGELRAKLLKLKLQHASLKFEKAELQEKCGLLFKPALLHDYDRTVEHIELKRERVKKLRNTVNELESRIAFFELQSRASEMSFARQSKQQQQQQPQQKLKKHKL